VRIEVRDAHKHFGPVHALGGVSFDVEPGRRVALVGPNGSGKSTLNRILMGLVACDGRVRVDGRCPFGERVAVARRMAYVPQAAPQIGAPVGEMLGAIARVRDLPHARIERTARAFDLDLASLARRPFRSLSGGMKQKLLIALALASDASLLILDEPTGSLDARSRERFFELFEALPETTTLVLCSHRLDEIRPLVGQVLQLDEGRVAYDGPADAFLARSGLAALDVWADGAEAGAWLTQRGFRRGASGAWHVTVESAAKLPLLADLSAALGARLCNLNARDLEVIELRDGDVRDA
jgi:ABC-type multidrug transport system ATPase subunit